MRFPSTDNSTASLDTVEVPSPSAAPSGGRWPTAWRQPAASWLSSRAGRNMLLLVVCNYLQAGIGFAMSLWLANRLGGEGFGTVSYCIVLGGICAAIAGFASEKTLVRDLVQSNQRNAVFTASIVQRCAVALLMIAASLALAWWTVEQDVYRAAAIVLGAVWGALLALMPTAWLDVRQQMGVSAAVMLGERLLFAFLAVMTLVLCSDFWLPVVVILCMVTARLLAFPVHWLLAARSFRPTTRNLTANIRNLTRENILVLGGALSALMLTHVNQIVLGHQSGAAHLGYYAIAFQFVSLVTLVQAQVLRLVTPRIAELTHYVTGATRRAMIVYCLRSFLLTLLLVLPLMLLTPWLLATCFRAEYQAAAVPLRVLCVWVILYGPALIVNQFLLCLHLNRAYLLLTMISGTLALLLGQLFIPRFGATGVALALLCSHVVSMTAQALLVFGVIRRRMRDTNPLTSTSITQAVGVESHSPLPARDDHTADRSPLSDHSGLRWSHFMRRSFPLALLRPCWRFLALQLHRLFAMRQFTNFNTYISALQRSGEGMSLLGTRDGLRIAIRNNTWDARIIRETFLERPYMKNWNPPAEPIILDIGAYLGDFSLFAAHYLNAHVVAYEPTEENYVMLQENVRLNSLQDRVRICHRAVGSQSEMRLCVRKESQEIHASSYLFSDGEQRTVPCDPLERVFERYGLSEVDLLKIDCEGAEFDILLSAPDDLFPRIKNLIFEAHLFEGARERLAETIQKLSRLGFTVRNRGMIFYANRATKPTEGD